MKILLTGFKPFGSLPQNPSEVVIERLRERPPGIKDAKITYDVLDVTYVGAGDRVEELICQIEPDLTILLGAAAERRAISLERFALNINDASKPDNEGVTRLASPIVGGGRAAYQAALPIDRVCQKIARPGCPVEVSNHAGTFVCNHVYYCALHQLTLLGLTQNAVFVHLPLPQEIASAHLNASYHWETLVATVSRCVTELATTV